jgi:glycosyltransferase involved in cell wall biosynthesis
MPPSLSVVIPVYNEPRWIGTVVGDLVTAVCASPFEHVELIIVDDGSDAATENVLAALEPPFPLRILRQPNRGRFIARQVGISAATGELVLLLDSRVSIRSDALAFVARELERTGSAPIWNAHVDAELRGNPFGRFLNVMESLAWRDYLTAPRTMSYGLKEFDRYPKGTTCFLAPRALLLEAIASFDSYFQDMREANDDTLLIRYMAARQPINISPDFSCLYRPRTAVRPFLRHTYHRGSVFIDGYGRPGARFFALIVAFYPLSALAVALAARRPRWLLPAVVAAPIAAGGAGIALQRSRPEVVALSTVGPIWFVIYAAGMWRGLWLITRARLRRASRLRWRRARAQ